MKEYFLIFEKDNVKKVIARYLSDIQFKQAKSYLGKTDIKGITLISIESRNFSITPKNFK